MDERSGSNEQVHFRGWLASIEQSGLQCAELLAHVFRHIQNSDVVQQIQQRLQSLWRRIGTQRLRIKLANRDRRNV